MAPHSSTLAWKTPCMEEPGRLQSMGSRRVGHDWSDFTFTFHFHALEKEMATRSSALAWRIPGAEEPGGLPSMGSHRVGHDWSDLAAAAAAEPNGRRLYPWFWPLYTASLVESLILLLIFPRGVFTTYTAASDTEQGTQHVRFSAVTRVLKDFTT